MTMIATYERGSLLNVRDAPGATAGVVRQMAPGESAACEEVRGGWCRLSDGYVRADLVTVTEGSADAAQAQAAPPAPDGDDAELRAMTNAQLYDLATKSGIKVRRGMSKSALISAILSPDA